MTHPTRFAIYRDRSPLAGPVYLGDVLAVNRDAAERDGATQYGAPDVPARLIPFTHILLERDNA